MTPPDRPTTHSTRCSMRGLNEVDGLFVNAVDAVAQVVPKSSFGKMPYANVVALHGPHPPLQHRQGTFEANVRPAVINTIISFPTEQPMLVQKRHRRVTPQSFHVCQTMFGNCLHLHQYQFGEIVVHKDARMSTNQCHNASRIAGHLGGRRPSRRRSKTKLGVLRSAIVRKARLRRFGQIMPRTPNAPCRLASFAKFCTGKARPCRSWVAFPPPG